VDDVRGGPAIGEIVVLMSPGLLLQNSPRRRLRRVVGTFLVACVAAAAAEPAPAHSSPSGDDGSTITTRTTDPPDSPGPLDIAAVAHRIRDYPGTRATSLRYVVTTFAAFADADLDPSYRRFVLELNRNDESGSERNVRISSRDGALVAELISDATRKVITTVPVHRRGPRALALSGAPRLIGARSYFWYSDYHLDGSADCGSSGAFPVTCQDDVPRHGWIRLDHPAWPPASTSGRSRQRPR
jgi:hypothetical protein